MYKMQYVVQKARETTAILVMVPPVGEAGPWSGSTGSCRAVPPSAAISVIQRGAMKGGGVLGDFWLGGKNIGIRVGADVPIGVLWVSPGRPPF